MLTRSAIATAFAGFVVSALAASPSSSSTSPALSLPASTTCTTALGASKLVKPLPIAQHTSTNTQTVTKPWTTTTSTTTTADTTKVISSSFTTAINANSIIVVNTTRTGPTTSTSTKVNFKTVATATVTTTVVAATSTSTLIASTWTINATNGFTPAQSLLPTKLKRRDAEAAVKKATTTAKKPATTPATGKKSTSKRAAATTASTKMVTSVIASSKPVTSATVILSSTSKSTSSSISKVVTAFPASLDCTTWTSTTITTNPGTQPSVIKTKSLKVLTTTTYFNVTKTHYTATVTNFRDIYTTTKTVKTTVTQDATGTTTATYSATATAIETPQPLGYYYSACGPDNLLNYTVLTTDPTNHVGISSFDGGNSKLSIDHADTGYECCVRCINQGQNCGGAVYSDQGVCFLLGFDTCKDPADNVFGAFWYDAKSPEVAGSDYTVMNGFCGSFAYAGGK